MTRAPVGPPAPCAPITRDPFGQNEGLTLRCSVSRKFIGKAAILLAAGLGSLWPVVVFAALVPNWTLEGLPLTVGGGERKSITIAADGVGGATIVWLEKAAEETEWRVKAQHLMMDGTVAPNWPLEGLDVTAPDATGVLSPTSVSDGRGGAWVCWLERQLFSRNVRYTRFTPTGPLLDEYGSVQSRFIGGGRYEMREPVLVPTRSGSVQIAWMDESLRFSATRLATMRVFPNLALSNPANSNGITVLTNYYDGGGSYVEFTQYPKSLIVSASGILMGPTCAISSQYHHEYYESRWNSIEGVDSLGTHVEFFPPAVRATSHRATGTSVDGISSLEMVSWASPDSLLLQHVPTSQAPGWSRVLGRVLPGEVDWRVLGTSDGGVLAARLLPGPVGVMLEAFAFDSQGSLKPMPSPVLVDEPGTVNSSDAWVADAHGGAVFSRSRFSSRGKDLWVGQVQPGSAASMSLSPVAVADGDQSASALTRLSDGSFMVAWIDTRSGNQEVRVQRMSEAAVTAIRSISVESEPFAGGVRLSITSDPSALITIERSIADGPWTALAQIPADRSGRTEFEDRDNPPAGRIGYRVTSLGQAAGESWLDWRPSPLLSIDRVSDSREAAAFATTLTLDPTLPARLELFDLLGRRLDSVSIESGAAGVRQVTVGSRGITSGLFLLRLSQGGEQVSRRVVRLQ